MWYIIVSAEREYYMASLDPNEIAEVLPKLKEEDPLAGWHLETSEPDVFADDPDSDEHWANDY